MYSLIGWNEKYGNRISLLSYYIVFTQKLGASGFLITSKGLGREAGSRASWNSRFPQAGARGAPTVCRAVWCGSDTSPEEPWAAGCWAPPYPGHWEGTWPWRAESCPGTQLSTPGGAGLWRMPSSLFLTWLCFGLNPPSSLLLTSPVSSLLRAAGFPCPPFSLGVSSVWNFSLECRCWAGPGHSATSSKLKKKVCPSCRHQCLLWPAGEGRAHLLAGGDLPVPRPPCWVREGSQALAKACKDRWAALGSNPLFIYRSKAWD